MNFKQIDTYLLAKKGATFDYPFDATTRVYRVMNKMFALLWNEESLTINLKCNPLYALELRSIYPYIKSGYHMNKKHWNTITIDKDINDELLKELIDHSYELIISKLTKKQKKELILK
ncbi:MAG: MmcQ/YjbR family DNA-binding protein [Sulfurovaceae bacterium]|nr:MmcQ/YjbR family DNA-binding protein [Sulfurovaceae bacterium]